MADFTNIGVMFNNIQLSFELLGQLRMIYSTLVKVEEVLLRYQTDPVFKIEADHLYGSAQIAELAAMIADVQSLRAGWAVNHKQLLLL